MLADTTVGKGYKQNKGKQSKGDKAVSRCPQLRTSLQGGDKSRLGLRLLLLLLLALTLGGATLLLDVLIVNREGLVNLELQGVGIIETNITNVSQLHNKWRREQVKGQLTG